MIPQAAITAGMARRQGLEPRTPRSEVMVPISCSFPPREAETRGPVPIANPSGRQRVGFAPIPGRVFTSWLAQARGRCRADLGGRIQPPRRRPKQGSTIRKEGWRYAARRGYPPPARRLLPPGRMRKRQGQGALLLLLSAGQLETGGSQPGMRVKAPDVLALIRPTLGANHVNQCSLLFGFPVSDSR